MRLNTEMFWKAYKQANETDKVDCMPSEEAASFLDWIATRVDYPELLELIREYPFRGDEQLCAHYFYGPQAIKEATVSSQLLAEKYLVVGCTANGDYIVLPLAKPQIVGFVNHETLDDEEGVCEYVEVSNDLGEFYYHSWNREGFPSDYYEATRNVAGSRDGHTPDGAESGRSRQS